MFRHRPRLPFVTIVLLAVATPGAFAPAPAGADQTLRGSGVATTETREVGGFHGIALGVPASLTLRQGDQEGVSITGDDNVVPQVETIVENGTLEIRWARKDGHFVDVKSLDIVVDVRSIEALAVRGSGRIRAPRLKVTGLRAAIDGSGRIALDALDTASLKVALRGNGRLAAAGRADSLDAAIAGSGELEAPKLESRRVQVTLNGSAKATVRARETLSATVAGSGEVRYHGKPRITQTVAGSGRIRPADDAS